jgi:predicted phosphodiesterase
MIESINNLLIIGDVHGLIDKYWKLHQKHKGPSIQVGDFGFKKQHEWHLANMNSDLHKINFGNHDDTNYLHRPHSLGNSSVLPGSIMTVRGAKSIDHYLRKEGVDFWSDEELNYPEMSAAIDIYQTELPRIIITHDAPHEIRRNLFGITDKTTTSNGLQAMWEIHQPDLWIFGHHHKSRSEVLNGTRFICLAELETITL